MHIWILHQILNKKMYTLNMVGSVIKKLEKVYFRSQILERPSIGEYWNISGVPVLSENVIFTFFRTCWLHSEASNTGMSKWTSIVQYSCTSVWDLKYTFSKKLMQLTVFGNISHSAFNVKLSKSLIMNWYFVN